MEIEEIISFKVVELTNNDEIDEDYVVVIELLAGMLDKSFLVKLPIVDHRLNKRLMHYKHIIN